MLRAARAGGASALLRVDSSRPESLKRALDLGPDGVVVPHVASAEEARRVVRACRYPHDGGVRGVAFPVIRASMYGTDPTYLAEYQGRTLVLPQIEDAAGVAEADGILGEDGVDGVFLGPLDLSSSVGHPGDVRHPDVAAATSAIEAAARRHGKLVCGFAAGGAGEARRLLGPGGYDLVAGAVDLGLLRAAAVADVGEARGRGPR